jgi:4'-phosphopantetheinyl transferase
MSVSKEPLHKPMCAWCPPSEHELRADQEIHFWQATLDRPALDVQRMGGLLSVEERGRAEQFRREIDSNRFIVRRALIRTILARYLHTEPNSVEFESGAHGKLHLSGKLARSNLDFSVSHSQGESLIAVGRGPVGVDLECIRPLPDVAKLLDQCLSPSEKKQLSSSVLLDPLYCFYKCWTCKEAYLKALGVGLTLQLDSVRLCFSAAESDGTAEVWNSEAESLFVRSFSPVDGYIAAAAFPHSQTPFQYFAI